MHRGWLRARQVVLESDPPETDIGPMKKRYTEEQTAGFLREADEGLRFNV